MLAVLDDQEWSGLPLVEQFRLRRAELVTVAANDDESESAVDYVPAGYVGALAFAELPS